MTNLTQKQRVEKRLREKGVIYRNECLRQFPAITRLSAIIQSLEAEEWVFEAEHFRGDYRYFVKFAPPKQEKLL